MQAYIIRRLLLIIVSVLLVSIIVFFSLRLIPGSIIEVMAAELTEQAGVDIDRDILIEQIKVSLGMDAPMHIQYLRWMGDIIRGDLGESLWTKTPVTEMVVHRLPVTFEIGILALAIAMLVAIPIGVYSATRQDTMFDYLGRTIAIGALAIPNFWIATIILLFGSLWFRWSPPLQFITFAENPIGNLGQTLLPAAIIGVHMSGTVMRMTRTMMLEVLRQDYIRTAWAKGLRERVIIMRHALKNALIPVITIIGLRVPILIGGSVVMETIFTLPGIGLLMVESLGKRDYTVVAGINMAIASFVLVINLLIDLTYAYLDPRIVYK
ncbi:ABC transporter permease [Chloroflexota bacterium]